MKKIVLLLVLLIGLQGVSNAQWQLRNNNISNGYSIITQISIPSAKVAYAIGENVFAGPTDLMYYTKTTNGGISWISGSIPGTQGLGVASIFAIDDNTVWLLLADNGMGRGRIYKSTDGGANWVRQGLNTFSSNIPRGIHFFNANDGVAFGTGSATYTGEIYTTTDGGNNWNKVPQANSPVSVQYEYIRNFTTNGNSIWIGTSIGRVYRSANKGMTWAVSTLPYPAKDVRNLAFSDANNGLVIADIVPGATSPDLKGLFRTTDGGITWTNISPPTAAVFYQSDICYVPGTQATFVQIGYDYVNGGNIIKGSSYSTDGGTTWVVMTSNMPREATSVKFFNQGIAYAGSYAIAGAGTYYNGGIYMFNTPPDVAVVSSSAPVSGCHKPQENVCMQVVNSGGFPASNIPVSFSVNGGAAVTGIMPGPLAPGGSGNFCFPTPANITTAGNNSIKISTLLPGDIVLGNDTLTTSFIAEPKPMAGFDVVPDSGRTFHFQNKTIGATSYSWHFGDNSGSNLQAPSHTYTVNGQYNVKLVTKNAAGCLDSATAIVNVNYTVPTPPLPPKDSTITCGSVSRVYPNPAKDIVYIRLDRANSEAFDVEIYSAIGQKVKTVRLEGQEINKVDLTAIAAGLYFMKITICGKSQFIQLVLD